VLADPRLADPTFLRLMALRRQKRQAQHASIVTAVNSPDALWNYVDRTWGVQIPRVSVCPGHVAQFTAFWEAYQALNSMYVWEASRGFGGKSYLLSLLGLTIACTRGGDVNILGGSGEQSKRVHDYMAKAWDAPGAPTALLRSDPLAMRTKLSNGATLTALLASSTSVRGSHIPTLLCDEVDEFDLRLFDAAMGQTMATPGHPAVTVLSSTHQYPQGTFTEVLKRAQERGWPVFKWCYRESLHPHGWLDPVEVARKQHETTAAMWETEYELQEPSPTSRAILPDAVAAMFRHDLGTYDGSTSEYLEYEAPVAGATYAHGADWAKSQDWTEIVTLRIDTDPVRLIAYERMQRLSWPHMVGRFETRLRRYPGQAAHDGTGIGDVVDGYLSVPAEAVIMVGRVRQNLFSEWINAIEQRRVVSPYIRALEAQYRYASVDDLYGNGHPPDGLVAGAMAWYASGLGQQRIEPHIRNPAA
jgi:hypothetical protein